MRQQHEKGQQELSKPPSMIDIQSTQAKLWTAQKPRGNRVESRTTTQAPLLHQNCFPVAALFCKTCMHNVFFSKVVLLKRALLSFDGLVHSKHKTTRSPTKPHKMRFFLVTPSCLLPFTCFNGHIERTQQELSKSVSKIEIQDMERTQDHTKPTKPHHAITQTLFLP